MKKIDEADKITFLPADDQNRPKLGFIVKEYIGPEVYKRFPDGSINTEHLLTLEDVQEGDELAIPWLTGGYVLMKAAKTKTGFTAHGENHCVILEFDIDERHCWVAGGFVNMKALERLKIQQ
jgi:hypothetical protein